MSIQAVAWVLDDSSSRALDRLVLIAMANHENEGLVGVSKATLAHEAGGISEATVWRSQQRLLELGEIGPVDEAHAPQWWLDIDPRRRPKLWQLVAFVTSRNAMATARQASRDAMATPTPGIAQGSRRDRAATRPVPLIPTVTNNSVGELEKCERCDGHGWIIAPTPGDPSTPCPDCNADALGRTGS